MLKLKQKLNLIDNCWDIIQLIAEKEFIAVTDISIRLKTNQSVISQALYKLRKASIVSFYMNGKFHIYYIHEDFFTFVEKFNHAIHRIQSTSTVN